jgi:RimJ/RimL family protein N-acetyltransferase
MKPQENADLVLRILHVIEQRQFDRLADLYHPEIEFRWPPGLPYSGTFTGPAVAEMSRRFAETWLPLQPTGRHAAWTLALLPQAITIASSSTISGKDWTRRAGGLRPRPWQTIRCATGGSCARRCFITISLA